MTYIWLAIIAVVIFLDQLTKSLTVLHLKPIPTQPIIENVIHLTYVENKGAAFGMLSNNRWVFMIVSSVAIVGLLVYLAWKKPTNKWECVALSFVIGGGIGNMIDRFALGYVVDMIDCRFINFAVFNVADSFVCVGAGILVVYLLRSMWVEYKQEKAEKAAAVQTAENADASGAEDDHE